MNRRAFLRNGIILFTAPAIVRASSLMYMGNLARTSFTPSQVPVHVDLGNPLTSLTCEATYRVTELGVLVLEKARFINHKGQVLKIEHYRG